jgi:hypothetical protein
VIDTHHRKRGLLTMVDTPSPIVTQLTKYRDPPTTSEWIDQKATPGPSTYASAASYTSTASKTTSTSSASSDATSHSKGLSTGAKAGIGAGVAGGVIFLAAVIIAIWLLRRRNKKATDIQNRPPPSQYPQSPHLQQMAAYPPQVGMPWTPYPQTGGAQDQYYHGGSYRSQDASPPSAGYGEVGRLGSLLKENKMGAAQHHRVPSAPEEVLRPMELEGEGPGGVHEIGEGHGK